MMIPYFDCHCDTIYRCVNEGGELRRNVFHLDLDRLRGFSPSAQVFAVCSVTDIEPQKVGGRLLSSLLSELNKNSDTVKLCLSFNDLNDAIRENKLAAFVSLEGAEQITELKSAYDAGVRIIHITWNYNNDFCGAAYAGGGGLTEKGKELVVSAQRMGFALDMSHISERGFWDVLEVARKPVIAGHSNSKAICDVPRNLTDEQFKALIEIGGGAGINLYPGFLGLNEDLNAAIAHIEHFLSLGGEKSVFLGCDLDGIDRTPDGINDVRDVAKLYNELLRLNYSEDTVKDIFWNNLYDVMGRML